MLLEVFLGGAEVDILNEDGPFVRVVSPRRSWNRPRGTAGFMLIYKVVRDHGHRTFFVSMLVLVLWIGL